tara:strand:- start:1425 stop:5828 length:4404 start_codon:yes stop_codon:yes gene_type:complete
MLGKIIKAAIAIALVSTGLQWITGTLPAGSVWGRAFWRQKVAGNIALLGLSYLSAKGSEDTTKQNLAIKSAGLNAIAARNVVYGKTRVGGTVVFRGTSGANNYLLHNVIALAGHEINDLKKIYIDAGQGLIELDLASDFVSATENGETVYRTTKSAFVNTDNDNAYTSGSLIKVTYEKGDQTTANGYAVNNIGAAWTTDHKLQGIAYIYIACVFDVEKFTRYPEFSFEIEGKKVVDPRVHETNRTFSSNPALIIRDYLKDNTYGFGATDTEINDEASGAGFKQAANDCDDDITTEGSSTEDRFALNGEFGSNEEPQRVLEHMLTSCGGQLTYNNGNFSLFVGKGRTAAGSITDDKVLAPVQITTKSSGMGSANGVKATYVRPSDNYIGGEITPYKDSTFLTEDTPSGEASASYEKYMNLTFPYTHTTYTAQRLARMALNYTRQDQTLSVVVPIEFLSYQVGDVVNFTNERLGYDGKDFEITAMSFEFMNDKYLAVRLDLKEYNSAVFNTFTYVTDPTLPTAPTSGDTSVSPPTSLSLSEIVKSGSVIKSASVFVKATWTNAVDEKIANTIVMYKKSTDSVYDGVSVGYPNNTFHFKADTGITYDVKAYHVSVAGIHSAETAGVQITVGAEAVTLNTGTIGGITIAADKLYEGTGTFNNSNTGFYLDDDGQFSLKDKLSFNGTTLTVSGNLTVENTIDAGKITLDGQDLSALISASGSGTGGTFIHNTKISQFKWVNGVGTTQWGLFIDNTNAQGRLGIGTASNPTSALHIYNTTPHIRLEDADTSEYVRIKGDDGNMVLEVDLAESDANSYLGIDIDNGERARFTSSGLSVTGNATISGDLTVSGTTTSIDTTNLDVKDKNITLNYGSGDTSSNADGAGITIQDAVNSSTDATFTWNASDDNFELSHGLDFGDSAKIRLGTDHDASIYHNGSDLFIDEADAGRIFIRSSNEVRINKYTGEFMVRAIADGSVYLYHDNTARLQTTSSGIDVNGTINGVGGNASAPSYIFEGNTDTGFFHPAVDAIGFSTAGSERMRINSSGQVGIGTTSPTEKLHVEGSLLLNVATSSGLGEEGIFFRSGFSDSNKYNISILSYAHDGSGNFSDGLSINGYDGVSFCTGSNSRQERMRIDSSGNVGIGDSSPSYPLDVKGKVGVGSDGTIRWGNAHDYGKLTWDTGKAIVRGESGKALSLGANATQDTIYINTSQNVGIGTTSPDNVLHVQESALSGRSASNSNTSLTLEHSTDTGIQFFSATQTQLRFGDAGSTGAGAIIYSHSDNILRLSAASAHRFTIGSSEAMRIDSSGNIGIGTSSPASGQKLTVSGDATVLGTMTCTTISKITGSFKIDHPLKPKTHSLVHSFVESPQADNTYSGKLRLIKGEAELNLDEYFGMTEGTIVALNRDFRVFTTNESNWDNVKGSVKNNILYIESNNPESMAEVSWLVIGERQDKEIHESDLTNDEGKIILEPSK